jgi:hypothetical protein
MSISIQINFEEFIIFIDDQINFISEFITEIYIT